MKVKVKTNLRISSWGGNIKELELKHGNNTVAALIEEISKDLDFPIIHPRTQALNEWTELLINGKNCEFLLNYLEREVKPEDEIILNFLTMGGG
jgi:hypothetical protein